MNINLNEVLAWAHHQKHPFTLEGLCNGVFGKPAQSLPIATRDGIRDALHNAGWKEITQHQPMTIFERPLSDTLVLEMTESPSQSLNERVRHT
ncbi:hypothetical protein XfCFBP8356_010500 [Xylella fastidiosa subsp. sandyi]|uniref:Uncharacterized protein n=1 Tax=Xylella fastidiosa subsp. fastidiosa TaxID=644356 RepID=A0AAJ5R2E4_XYLFS|nr:hypothetical protein [Xylella fastidiosa]KQH74367.1 hypothetical protein AOT81_04080 [Xylella fastidiosa]RWA43480.1 hypothetical protein XfCFBP8356_11685 [Xylella fastidiosa subsp. sandyi]WCF27750.1 hypothetical protein OK117_08895 [Xylella fastidiosa subsp. fastidiosa]WCF27874.1 hypothetical protein OK117_09575 [Xylella fastidiosa subsp. fastidiosa]WNY18633.1 hypothetical protein RO839_09115 [Xylella fastidiosa]